MSAPRWFWIAFAVSFVLLAVSAAMIAVATWRGEWVETDDGRLLNRRTGEWCNPVARYGEVACFNAPRARWRHIEETPRDTSTAATDTVDLAPAPMDTTP